jgi:hypothetical protein
VDGRDNKPGHDGKISHRETLPPRPLDAFHDQPVGVLNRTAQHLHPFAFLEIPAVLEVLDLLQRDIGRSLWF